MVNRPHCPRDPQLRAFLAELGCEWPEPEPLAEGAESQVDDETDDEYEESEESDGDGEDECVDPDETSLKGQNMKVEMDTSKDGGGTTIEVAKECTKEELTGTIQNSKCLQGFVFKVPRSDGCCSCF